LTTYIQNVKVDKNKPPDINIASDKPLGVGIVEELLEDPFLQIDDYESNFKELQYQRDCYEVTATVRQQPMNGNYSIRNALMNGYTHNLGGYKDDFETSEIDLFDCEEEDPLVHHHQADPVNITLPDPFQANAVPHNQYERCEGDDETQVNATSKGLCTISKTIPTSTR